MWRTATRHSTSPPRVTMWPTVTRRSTAIPPGRAIRRSAIRRSIATRRRAATQRPVTQSLYNSTGTANTANGQATLYNNTTGSGNTALGSAALYDNNTGSNNIAIGGSAGFSLTTGSNNIDIGNVGVGGESTTIRIGAVGTHSNAYIAGINGVTVAAGIGVIVDSNGHLGTSTSSARYKENIQPMDKASEAILALKPVTFRYKKELDPKAIPQFGLVAEQVAKVNPALVDRDGKGEIYTVRYEAVNAMLLNEFLKEYRTVQELEATVAQQQKEIQ